MYEGEWVKCPVCGWHWKRFHTGRHAIQEGGIKPSKGEFSFHKGDPEADAFISIRQMPGGRGNPETFRESARITLSESKGKEEYTSLRNSLKEKIQKILQILKD